jgi:hemoglobin
MSSGPLHDPDFVVPPNPLPPPGGITLYERLGGCDGISRFVKWFYARARFDPELESIFRVNVPIWSTHLAVLTDFWTRMTGGPSTYSGSLAGAHAPLKLEPEHFAAWLKWWDRTCREVLALTPAEAAEMSALGHRLAEQMQRKVPASAA